MDRRDGFELVLGLGLIAGAAWATERLVSRLLESAAETASINALIPPAAAALRNLRDALAQAGINTRVGSTRRTTAEQAAALASGHSSTTHSWHLHLHGHHCAKHPAGIHRPRGSGGTVVHAWLLIMAV